MTENDLNKLSADEIFAVKEAVAREEEAADFAKFLLTPEMQKLRFNLTQAMPAIDIKVESPSMDGFIKQLEYAVPMPLVSQMGKFWEALGNASGEIWMGGDISTAMDRCNAEILR